MELHIDNRETIKSFFNDYKWVTIKNLNLGDYIFYYNNEVILIIERKTINDLANSINDGRYREQKNRLLENFKKEQILYLIEGDIQQFSTNHKISKNTLYSSIINLLLRDNLHFYKSNSKNETIEFLLSIAKKFKNGIPYSNDKKENKNDVLFNNYKLNCKKNVNIQTVFNLQLSCIPGVSLKTSKVIQEKFKTIPNLITELNQLSKEERIELIKTLAYTTSTNKKRKLGIKVAQNINKYLFDTENNS